jgi:hypothetical protein
VFRSICGVSFRSVSRYAVTDISLHTSQKPTQPQAELYSFMLLKGKQVATAPLIEHSAEMPRTSGMSLVDLQAQEKHEMVGILAALMKSLS